MADLSKKQAAVRNFIASEQAAGRSCPSHREIAAHFGFASSYAAACHVKALIRKGALVAEGGKARALRLADAFKPVRRAAVADIPIFGSIPAGPGQDREQETEGCITVDVATLGFKPTRNTFALRVTGDSMIGKHICDGDIAVFEHGPEPRAGQIVAALIDRKNTLKTFVVKNGKPFLKAEMRISAVRSGRTTSKKYAEQPGSHFRQVCAIPPSTKSSMPFTKLLSSDARKMTACVVESQRAKRSNRCRSGLGRGCTDSQFASPIIPVSRWPVEDFQHHEAKWQLHGTGSGSVLSATLTAFGRTFSLRDVAPVFNLE